MRRFVPSRPTNIRLWRRDPTSEDTRRYFRSSPTSAALPGTASGDSSWRWTLKPSAHGVGTEADFQLRSGRPRSSSVLAASCIPQTDLPLGLLSVSVLLPLHTGAVMLDG